jgi:hypothetical protein
MEKEPSAKSPRIQKLEAELREWGLDVEKFASRARQAASSAKPRLDELKKAGGESAREVEKGLEAAWADLKKAFDQAAARFRQSSK